MQTVENGRLAELVRQVLLSCGHFQGRQAACVLSPVAGEFGHPKLMYWFWSNRHAELTGSTEGLGLS